MLVLYLFQRFSAKSMKTDDLQSPFGSTQVMKSVIFIKNHVISKKKKTANIEYYWGRVAKVGGHG